LRSAVSRFDLFTRLAASEMPAFGDDLIEVSLFELLDPEFVLCLRRVIADVSSPARLRRPFEKPCPFPGDPPLTRTLSLDCWRRLFCHSGVPP